MTGVPSSATTTGAASAFDRRSMFAVGSVLAVSLLGMRFAGLHYAVPLALVFIVALVFPFAFGVATVIACLERSELPTQWRLVMAPLFGVALLCMYWPDRVWFLYPTVIVCGWVAARYSGDGTAVRMTPTVLMVGAIYVIVWNGNYLALVASRSRLHDASMRALDQAIYSSLVGGPIAYDGWFPLIHNPWLSALFERAYLSLFAEIALVLVLLARQTDALRWFVARLTVCYAGGLLVFVLWPVAGPYLVYPASISAAFTTPDTRTIMQSSLVEFSAIRSGGQPTTGFGYFVGFPSLHVAMAILLQFTIQQRSRIAGCVVAPMNALLVASTFVLGYHYLADVPGGMLLALGALGLVRPRAVSSPVAHVVGPIGTMSTRRPER
jgi:hypothetical protein